MTALLAIAGAMVNSGAQPDRGVVFAAVGAEESGFEGSEHLMGHTPTGFDADQVVYNVNMDMVGSYTASETLFAFGTPAGSPGRAAISDHLDEHLNIDMSRLTAPRTWPRRGAGRRAEVDRAAPARRGSPCRPSARSPARALAYKFDSVK